MSRSPITRGGWQLLRDELDRLKREDRPRVILEIKEARSHGDISENAEYHAAREKQGIIEAKVRDLESKLSSCEIVEVAPGDKERVSFGCTVTLEDLDSGDETTYRIVGPYEADINQKLLSVTSPIARALIGKGVGDEVTVQAPGGARQYEILRITV